MVNPTSIKKLKEKIDANQSKLEKLNIEIQKIWEDTGLDPNEQSYLIEKTMRFELAKENVNELFTLFERIIEDYKKLCTELERTDE